MRQRRSRLHTRSRKALLLLNSSILGAYTELIVICVSLWHNKITGKGASAIGAAVTSSLSLKKLRSKWLGVITIADLLPGCL
jgi:hypothetical protein